MDLLLGSAILLSLAKPSGTTSARATPALMKMRTPCPSTDQIAKPWELTARSARRPGIFDHAIGEGKERTAPAAREPPRSAV